MNEQRCTTPQLVLWYRDFLQTGKAAAFVSCVATRYSLATLARMTKSRDHEMRRASVLALGMIGGAESISVVGTCLRDSDRCVRLVAEISFGDLCRREMGSAAANRLNAIRRHIDGHRYSKAVGMLRDLVEMWPNYAEAWYQLAITNLGLSQYEKALKAARRAIELNPNHYSARTLQARCWLEKDRASEALKCFEASFEVNPSQFAVKEYISVLRRQARL